MLVKTSEATDTVGVSIIIPFKDAQRTLEACLASVFQVDYPHFEVILVDNNSTDKSREIVEKFAATHCRKIQILVLDEKQPGPAAARNKGASQSSGRLLAFTDADCIVDKNWLSESIKEFDDQSIGAVAGNIIGYSPKNAVDAFHSAFTYQYGNQPRIFDRFTITSGGFPAANLIIRRDLFDLIEGFDGRLPLYGEDYDLCARIYDHNYKVKYIPSAKVKHINRYEISTTWKQAFGFGYSHALLWRRYGQDFLLSIAGNWAIRSKQLPVRGWVDLSTADKKLLYLLFAALFFPPLILLVPLYFIYLAVHIGMRCKQRKVDVNVLKLFAMSGLLLLKSAAMTAGHIRGGLRYRVICF